MCIRDSNSVDIYEDINGKWGSTCSISTVPDGTTVGTGLVFDSELEAADVKWRIDPLEGSCLTNPPLPNLPDPIYEPVPYTDPETNCTYNVQLLDFVEAYTGGPINPVFKITQGESIPEGTSRTGGGVIGGCNFQPTVYYNPDGPGPPGPPLPPFPYIPGDNDDGKPKWLDTLLAGLAGAATALATDLVLEAIKDAFATQYPGVIYRMVSVCEKDESGEPISEAVEVPIAPLKAPDAQVARLDAIVELLQASKNFKQPTCEQVQPIPEGDFRTISFRSTETSPYGNSRLRKRLRYRAIDGVGLGELVDYWKDFEWEAGPIRVRHIGSSWGAPEVWAATEDEGKRVLRHAAGEAGIDPDQVGRWSTRRSDSTRLGVPATMKVDTTGGYYWITSRDGSDNRPEIGLLPDQ